MRFLGKTPGVNGLIGTVDPSSQGVTTGDWETTPRVLEKKNTFTFYYLHLRLECGTCAPCAVEDKTASKSMQYTLSSCEPGGGSPRKKAPKSASPSKTHMPSVKTAPDKKQEEAPSTAPLAGVTAVRKSSVLRAASALGIINEKPQPIIYTPRRAWISQPTTEDLLRGREVRRMRYGTDIDFADYKPSFQKHITLKAESMEAEDN
ncbi:hypothetical protein ACROYT_G003710 [Oculina patagonica]